MTVYIHFNIHNYYFDYYKLLFYSQILIFISIFTFISYYFINKKYLKNTLLILGINPFICVFYSSLFALEKDSGKITLCILYFLFFIIIIVPFYKMNHLCIHLFMSAINYSLALNNIKY